MSKKMKIMRYRQRIVGDFTPDPEMGPWCRYKEVEPLLERIKELERQLEFERSLEDWEYLDIPPAK